MPFLPILLFGLNIATLPPECAMDYHPVENAYVLFCPAPADVILADGSVLRVEQGKNYGTP